jgi:hypothetical protein
MFESANDFSLHIETIANQRNIGVVDALLEYCNENFIEPEEVTKLINKSLKDKLEMHFVDMNYLPKQAFLDF